MIMMRRGVESKEISEYAESSLMKHYASLKKGGINEFNHFI